MIKVVVDTDYFRFITRDCSDSFLFLKIMEALECAPIMHEYVYKEELHEHSFVKKLVQDGYLTIVDYDSLTSDEENKNEYIRLFKFAYYEMNYKKFEGNNIKEYRHEKENLGEIHSVILAKILGYSLMMSNDGDARTFIETKVNTSKNSIKVVNIELTFIEMITPNVSKLKWPDIKSYLTPLKNSESIKDRDKYNRIRNVWCN